MKKHFWWMSVALWLPLQAAAQDERFHSPVDIPFLMSGSFGEPRPNHFHCGIDVKTQGVVGKRVLSVCDGYVSRLTVGYDGFGNALYVTHRYPFIAIWTSLCRRCRKSSVAANMRWKRNGWTWCFSPASFR